MNDRFFEFSSTIRSAAGLTRITVATALCCGTALAQAAPIALGGFEAPVLQQNSFVKNPSQPDWVFSGNSGGIQRNGSPWGAPPAPEGQQTAFLQGGNAKMLSKERKLEAGVYTVSFYAARRAFGGEVANPIMVKVNGHEVVATAISPEGTTFQKYTTPRFPLESSSNYAVELSSTNAAGDHTTFIDAVTIDKDEYQLGVYYYPGWKSTPEKPYPWADIKKYNDGEREPLQGWYDDGSVAVAENHINAMADHGINFVVYDWYWENQKVSGSHAVDAYLMARNNHRVKFALLWDVLLPAKEGPPQAPVSYADYENIVNYWIDNYFARPQYHKVDGKPVVFIHFHDELLANARKFDKDATVGKLLNLANELAKRKGLNGIYFVASLGSGTPSQMEFMPYQGPNFGYSALSSYNLHSGVGPTPVMSHSYPELDVDYSENWDFNLKWSAARAAQPSKDGPVPYFIPMTSGWDLGPLGGTSSDKEHDKSVSTPETFEKHLLAAKARMDKYPLQSMKTGMICCWNEFGEGSYIEPTKKYGTQYLERVKKVFRTP